MTLVLSITSGNFIAGSSIAFASPAGHDLQSANATDIFGDNITMTLQQVSWMAGAWPIGLLIGCALAGHTMERFGRKNNAGFVIGSSFLIANLVIALAFSPLMIVLGRLISGAACGLQFSSWMVYLMETTRPDFRGGVICYVMIWESLGTIFIFALSIVLDWKYLALAGVFCALIFMTTIHFCAVESPVWLYKKNKLDKCVEVLKWLCDDDDDAKPDDIIIDFIKPALKSDGATLSCDDIKEHWPSITISMILILSYYSLSYSQILAYLNTLLDLFRVETAYLGPISLVISIGQLLSTFCAILFSKKFNRKPILVSSSFGMALCLGLLSAL